MPSAMKQLTDSRPPAPFDGFQRLAHHGLQRLVDHDLQRLANHGLQHPSDGFQLRAPGVRPRHTSAPGLHAEAAPWQMAAKMAACRVPLSLGVMLLALRF